MALCGYYSTDDTKAVRPIDRNNTFDLPSDYLATLKAYLSSQSRMDLVAEWIFNSSDFHDDDLYTELLNHVILDAPQYPRKDALIRVVRHNSQLPTSDRLMSCAYAQDDVQKTSWTLVWGSRGARQWTIENPDAEHCCLIELNVQSHVPRLYCVAVGDISDHQSEVVLPLGCQYEKVDERVEKWRVKRVRDHNWPLPARMQQYYVYPSQTGFVSTMRILTYNVTYPKCVGPQSED